MSENYKGKYFDYLCELINLDSSKYECLIHELYSIDFKWVLPLDEDRAFDGLILREGYYDYRIDYERIVNKPCSVLECLIGLAYKMDYILDDDDRGNRMRLWFWEMVENLDLMRFTNEYLEQFGFGEFEDHHGGTRYNMIHAICDDWMNRNFIFDGQGSPFPLNYPKEDQRKLDLVRQLNAYILEKHMFEDELL